MSAGSRLRVVVANPGHTPWLARSASGLARHDELRAYIAPMVLGPTGVHRLGRLGSPLGARVRGELLRRQPTDEAVVARSSHCASIAEAAAVIGRRLPLPHAVQRRLADGRDRRFDRHVSARIEPSDTVAHLAYGSALRTVRRAQAIGVATMVEQAVHHHAFCESLLREELRLCPDYAATMQFHQVPARRRSLLDAENREADRIVCLSRFSRRTFIDAGVDPSRVVANQLGVDVDRFRSVSRRADGLFRVVFLGVLTQRKGLSYAVEGFDRAGLPSSTLLLAGTPWGSSDPWKRARNVTHMPWVPSERVPDLLATADVLVLPSLVEGFARVVLEAMAAGVPVVVTPNTGGEDAVRDGESGYVVPIRDADAIAERLRRLHADPDLRARMGAAARERAASFTWSAYSDRMRGIARELADA